MDYHIMWTPWAEPGLEHLHLYHQQEEIVADGLVIGVYDQRPFRAHYEIHCTKQWKLRAIQVRLLEDSRADISLLTDGDGNWRTAQGETIPTLQGCFDVDISCTPFTNTLPLHRLALATGDAATLNMVYIAVPQMSIHVAQQRYTCLEGTPVGGRYRFESWEDGVNTFTADLPVDRDKLVLDYPQLFTRTGTWKL